VSDLTRTMDRVKKDEDRQAKSLEELEQGAADIAQRKDEAAGTFSARWSGIELIV
jgi:hypothetical protein